MNDHHHGNHDHSQGHAPGQAHAHTPTDFGAAFKIGIALNIGFVATEAVFGVLANSVALLADAGHNLIDVLGLVVAWSAASLSRRIPTTRFTYGLRSSSILAALFNTLVLLFATGGIAWEAIGRFSVPHAVSGKTVIIVAAVGIFINGITAWLFASGRKGDINIRGAFLHMAADAVVSAGVVIAGIAIIYTGADWIDPLASLVIAGVIVWSSWGLLRDSVNMALHAVPSGIDPLKVRGYLEKLPGVDRIHDLHIWPMSTTETALTCHLVMSAGHPGDPFLSKIATDLRDRYRIQHATIQIEFSENAACPLMPDDVV